jgi:hypothetical protein
MMFEQFEVTREKIRRCKWKKDWHQKWPPKKDEKTNNRQENTKQSNMKVAELLQYPKWYKVEFVC